MGSRHGEDVVIHVDLQILRLESMEIQGDFEGILPARVDSSRDSQLSLQVIHSFDESIHLLEGSSSSSVGHSPGIPVHV